MRCSRWRIASACLSTARSLPPALQPISASAQKSERRTWAKAMLQLDSIEASYDQNQVLFGAALEVRQGEVVALMGRNGMGKTTTVNNVVGLIRPHRGSIHVRRPLAERPAALSYHEARDCPRARGPADISNTFRTRKSGRNGGQLRTNRGSRGRSIACTNCFLSLPSAAITWAISFQGANNRCWRSVAR